MILKFFIVIRLVQKRMSQKFRIFSIIFLSVIVFSFGHGCGFKKTDNELKDRKQIIFDYVKRLKHRDKSLLSDLNLLTSENCAINGWIGENEGQKGFYVRFENLGDKALFIHRPDYSIGSGIYKKGDENWVDITIVDYLDIPHVVLPHSDLVFHFSFKESLPVDINLQVTFSMPQYNDIANDGELKYSQYRLIKQFTITKTSGDMQRVQNGSRP